MASKIELKKLALLPKPMKIAVFLSRHDAEIFGKIPPGIGDACTRQTRTFTNVVAKGRQYQ